MIVPFQQKFEAWRETWLRGVLADSELGASAKSIAAFMNFYLNRETRGCFLLYETIAIGTAMSRRCAMENMKQLVERGHVRREPRRGKSNLLFPIVSGQNCGQPCEQSYRGGEEWRTPGVNNGAPQGVKNGAPITSDIEPLTLTCSSGLPTKERKQGRRRPIFISSDDPCWTTRVIPYAHLVLGFTPRGGCRSWSFSTDEWKLIEAAAAANGGGR